MGTNAVTYGEVRDDGALCPEMLSPVLGSGVTWNGGHMWTLEVAYVVGMVVPCKVIKFRFESSAAHSLRLLVIFLALSKKTNVDGLLILLFRSNVCNLVA